MYQDCKSNHVSSLHKIFSVFHIFIYITDIHSLICICLCNFLWCHFIIYTSCPDSHEALIKTYTHTHTHTHTHTSVFPISDYRMLFCWNPILHHVHFVNPLTFQKSERDIFFLGFHNSPCILHSLYSHSLY